jgi:hypothetical protein
MNKALAGALIAALAVASCASNREARQKNPAPCPNIVVLADAARFVEFDGEQTLENVVYSGEITSAEIACRYVGDKPIEAEVDLTMAFGKGPKGENGDKAFSYFVAVARRDLEVIAKEKFPAPVEFTDSRRVVVFEDDVDKIVIPRAGENTSGVNFEIIVGFNLTPEQAIFNRSGKSLKFPNLQ